MFPAFSGLDYKLSTYFHFGIAHTVLIYSLGRSMDVAFSVIAVSAFVTLCP